MCIRNVMKLGWNWGGIRQNEESKFQKVAQKEEAEMGSIFKLTSIVYAEDQIHDAISDFQTKTDQWHRSTSIAFHGSKRKNLEKFCPNQAEQEVIPPPEPEKSAPIPSLNSSFSSIPSSSKNKDSEDFGPIHPFTLIDGRSIHCNELRKRRSVEPKNIETRNDVNPKTILGQYLELERWVTAQSNVIEVQRRKEEAQNAYLKLPSNIHRSQVAGNPVFQLNSIPNVVMPAIRSNQRTQSTSATYFYSNQAQWSIIWNIEKFQNIPLILDRNDRYIVFSDKLDGERKKRLLRQWDKLEILPADSNYYLQLATKTIKKTDIQHSNTAISLALIQPTIDDFENFHHPKFLHPSVFSSRVNQEFKVLGIVDSPPNDTEHPISPYLKELDDLSARNGIVYIVEHTVEVPPFIMNVGMSSLITTYWHKESPNDVPPTYDKTMKILEPDDESPFTAQIPNNQPVQAISCLLYRVPVFQHDVQPFDFLLIKSKSTSENQFFIRRFNGLYCAGMLESLTVVMQPSLKPTQKFIEDFTKAMLINIFRGTEQYKGRRRFTLAKIQQEYFPDMNETKLRKIVQNYATFSREQTKRIWELNPTMTKQQLDQSFNSLNITPEKVCSYQSMLVGLWRLKKSGINILTSSERLYQKIKKLKGTITQHIAEKIEIELMKTPWSKTRNFEGAFRSNAMETFNSDDGQQVYRKRSRRSKIGQSTQSVIKRQIAQTGADLRSLSLKQLEEKLLSFGVPLAKIKSLGRWDQVALLREIATRNKDEAVSSSRDVELFARGPRNDYQASLEKYKAQYQSTFDNNLIYISSVNVGADEADSINESLLDELGLEVLHNNLDDDDDDDIDLSILQESDEHERATSSVNLDDPPQLRPYSVYTYPVHIDWDDLGFEGVPRRKIAKIINVSFTDNGLELNINWERRSEKISELLKKKSAVYPSESPLDFCEDVYKKRKNKLQKIKKWKLSSKSTRANAPFVKFESYFTDDLLVSDSRNSNQYYFVFSPAIKRQIARAVDRFKNFEKQSISQSSSSKRSSMNNNQSSDNDEPNNDEYRAGGGSGHRAARKKKMLLQSNPIADFNHYCKKYLKLFRTFKHMPKYRQINQKIAESRYVRAEDFWSDMEELKPLTSSECTRLYDKNLNQHKQRFFKLEKRIQRN